MADISIAQNPPMALRVKDVAALLSVGVSTVWYWVAQGKFPQPFRVGRTTLWRQTDIQKWLDDQATGGGDQ